ncbi:MAG: hypothetical protein ACJASU_000033 [Cognaticolwellia sp.]
MGVVGLIDDSSSTLATNNYFKDIKLETKNLTTVTIIYYQEDSLELKHEIKSYPKNKSGRVIIPQEFKQNKSIVAVCLGEITIINKIGDRIIPLGIEDENC